MGDKRWRVRFYNYNSTTLSTGNVYYQTTVLDKPITVLGPIVRAADGRTEAQPWNIDVVDDGSSFTRQLADSSGRMIMLGRVVSAERSVNGSSFAYHGAGRVADVFLTTNPGVYRVTVEDERRVERQSVVFFTTNTTRLYPAGPHRNFGGFAAPPKGVLKVQYQSTVAGTSNYKYITFYPLATYPFPQMAAEAIANDLIALPLSINVSTSGNFTYARLRIGNTDYPIVTFGNAAFLKGSGVTARVGYRPAGDYIGALSSFARTNQCALWILDKSSVLSVGTQYSSAFLHMFGAPPSKSAPLHLGTSSGLSPLTAAKQVYAGTYSAGSGEKVRYSTAAFDSLALGDYPTVIYRVTGQSNMADWLEQNVYQPFLLAPVVDVQGRVAPISLRPLNSTSGVTRSFSGSNLREPYPTWDHPLRQTVTVVNAVFNQLAAAAAVFQQGAGSGNVSATLTPSRIPGSVAGGDGLYSFQSSAQITHDRVTQIGRYTANLTMNGLYGMNSNAIRGGTAVPMNFPTRDWAGSAVVDYLRWYAHGIFPRFGDGPVFGTLYGLSSAEVAQPGDWAKLTIPQYPNAAIPGRGGSRFVQLLTRNDTPLGPEFQFLDGGPQVAPPSAPTLTLSTSTGDSKHSVVATVGGVPSGSTFQLQYALSTSLPSSGSLKWQVVLPVSSGGKYRIGRLPANRAVWARTKTVKNGRLYSAWTNSTRSRTTGKLTGPTGLASTSVGPSGFTLTWTAGEVDAVCDVHVDPSTAATLGSSNRVARLTQALANRYTVAGTTRGHKYLAAVRYADYYGGFSTANSIGVTTSTTALPVAPKPLGISILSGGLI